jgi:hypothetical protein
MSFEHLYRYNPHKYDLDGGYTPYHTRGGYPSDHIRDGYTPYHISGGYLSDHTRGGLASVDALGGDDVDDDSTSTDDAGVDWPVVIIGGNLHMGFASTVEDRLIDLFGNPTIPIRHTSRRQTRPRTAITVAQSSRKTKNKRTARGGADGDTSDGISVSITDSHPVSITDSYEEDALSADTTDITDNHSVAAQPTSNNTIIASHQSRIATPYQSQIATPYQSQIATPYQSQVANINDFIGDDNTNDIDQLSDYFVPQSPPPVNDQVDSLSDYMVNRADNVQEPETPTRAELI